MVNIDQILTKLKPYISSQIDAISTNTPLLNFMKPLIMRALEKKFDGIKSALDLIADSEGNIDVEGILTEMADNIVNTKPFTVKVPMLGDIKLGGGNIELNIPYTDKSLIFNKTDIDNIKQVLISNN